MAVDGAVVSREVTDDASDEKMAGFGKFLL